MKLLENTGINEYAIQLVKKEQPSYRFIYAFNSVEWVTLTAYIKTHLKTGFIQPSKSPAWAFIFFDKKLNGSLWLCINYWGLNNLTIKNQYPLLLISELLNWLGQTKRFIQLDVINVYH